MMMIPSIGTPKRAPLILGNLHVARDVETSTSSNSPLPNPLTPEQHTVLKNLLGCRKPLCPHEQFRNALRPKNTLKPRPLECLRPKIEQGSQAGGKRKLNLDLQSLLRNSLSGVFRPQTILIILLGILTVISAPFRGGMPALGSCEAGEEVGDVPCRARALGSRTDALVRCFLGFGALINPSINKEGAHSLVNLQVQGPPWQDQVRKLGTLQALRVLPSLP